MMTGIMNKVNNATWLIGIGRHYLTTNARYFVILFPARQAAVHPQRRCVCNDKVVVVVVKVKVFGL